MTIFKAKNSIEEYKYRTFSKDINELSGRTGRKMLTDFVNKEIIKIINELNLINCNLIDIGCGDGSLVKMAANSKNYKNIIGISPNIEEVVLIEKNFQESKLNIKPKIKQGNTTNIPFQDQMFDITVINGVLLLLENEQKLIDSILEIKRISKANSYLFIGEMPFLNECSEHTYGDSILLWLIYVLRVEGYKEFLRRLKQVAKSLVSKEPFIIFPKRVLFYEKESFIKLLQDFGFELVFSKPHKELDNEGNKIISRSRNDYLFKKVKH